MYPKQRCYKYINVVRRHVHNEYGLFYIRGTHEGSLQRADSKYRPFILTRAVFSGTQRYVTAFLLSALNMRLSVRFSFSQIIYINA